MSNHLVDVVNIKDEVIGVRNKHEKEDADFISRVIAVFLFDNEKRLLLCKRAPNKKYSPNLYDCSAVGAVISNETYEDAAKRELKEELDIECDLVLLARFYEEAEMDKNGSKLKYFCSVFMGITEEIPHLNEELSEIKKICMSELKNEMRSNKEKFCPGFVNDFAHTEKILRDKYQIF